MTAANAAGSNDNLSDDELLDKLDTERSLLSYDRDENARRVIMRGMIEELISRGVYPAETVPDNPNDVYGMVDGWGARWHIWKAPLECPSCHADLRDRRVGPPFKRGYCQCPDCAARIAR